MNWNWKADEFNAKLAAAVDSFDRDEAADLCQQLIDHVRERDEAYPLDHARKILAALRKKRYFTLLQQVADAFIQNEQDAPRVRRMYAQSQLDLSNLTAAIGTLEVLAGDTAPGGRQEDSVEHAEAQGLLGRAYKQLYVDADHPERSRNRRHLERAISYYRGIYESDGTKVWQGINGVALVRRAERDGVALSDIAGLKLKAKSDATEILAKVKSRDLERKADTWDFATAVEACVGLDEHDEALRWLTRYMRSEYADAFELGSTYRQLTEVWKLDPTSPPGDLILPALRAALVERQGSEIEISFDTTATGRLAELSADEGYEKVLGTESFRTLQWFNTCMSRARSVARVEDKFGNPVGTGFVVRGVDLNLKDELADELLLLTNAHVVSGSPSNRMGIRPKKAEVRFDLWGDDGTSPDFKLDVLWSSPPADLDATLLRLEPGLDGVEPIPITTDLPSADGKERAYIIGHPEGRKLSFSIHDNYLLDYDDRVLHYRSPTEPGSSGSPVFNDDWDLIGLHHAGTKRMPRLHDQDGTYPANEGIWIQAIAAALDTADLN